MLFEKQKEQEEAAGVSEDEVPVAKKPRVGDKTDEDKEPGENASKPKPKPEAKAPNPEAPPHKPAGKDTYLAGNVPHKMEALPHITQLLSPAKALIRWADNKLSMTLEATGPKKFPPQTVLLALEKSGIVQDSANKKLPQWSFAKGAKAMVVIAEPSGMFAISVAALIAQQSCVAIARIATFPVGKCPKTCVPQGVAKA